MGFGGVEVLQFNRVLRKTKGRIFSPVKNTDILYFITLICKYPIDD